MPSNVTGTPRPRTPGISSVLDVQGVAQGLVEPGPGGEVELADGFWVQDGGGDGDQVVAVDDALIGQALSGPDFDLRADTSDRSGDRRAGDSGEDCDSGVSRKYADGSPPGWWTEVSPDDVAALYHSGAVSDASLDAAETIAGSWGTLR